MKTTLENEKKRVLMFFDQIKAALVSRRESFRNMSTRVYLLYLWM